jgi:hypothetical protein
MTARSNAVLADSPERVLIIERIFDAPREMVFKCWTENRAPIPMVGP